MQIETDINKKATEDFAIPSFEIEMPCNSDISIEGDLNLKGRNSKIPKKANHGAKPCSSVMRKLKRFHHFKNMRTK